MSIIPASRLSPCELNSLGNNLRPASPIRPTPAQRANRRVVAAVNRSLSAILDEGVPRLHRRHSDDDGLSPVPVDAA